MSVLIKKLKSFYS
jgi:hypothetical protein